MAVGVGGGGAGQLASAVGMGGGGDDGVMSAPDVRGEVQSASSPGGGGGQEVLSFSDRGSRVGVKGRRGRLARAGTTER